MKLLRPVLTCAIGCLLPLMAATPCQAEGEAYLDNVKKFRDSLVDPAMVGFGRFGISTTMTGVGTMDFEDGDGEINLYEVRQRVPLGGLRWEDGLALAFSLKYQYSSLDLNSALGLGRQDLHDLDLNIVLARFPAEERGWMGTLIVTPGLNTDFSDVDGDDFSFRAIAAWGYRFSEEFALVTAAMYNYSIGEELFVPGVGVIWRPSDEWILQLTPPIVALGWTPRKNVTFSLAGYPSGSTWSVEPSDSGVEAIRLQSWRVGVGMEYRLGKRWRITAVGGVTVGSELELRDGSERVLLGRDLDSAAYATLGIGWLF